MSKCRHFIGVQHKTCEAGVEMASVRDVSQPGMARWPCITFDSGKAATTVCPKRELMTKEDFEAQDAKFLMLAAKFDQDVHDGNCPHCGAPIEPAKIVGRCRYASCGHRVGQLMTEEEEP